MPRNPDWFCDDCNWTVFGSKPACKCGKPNPNWDSSNNNNASASASTGGRGRGGGGGRGRGNASASGNSNENTNANTSNNAQQGRKLKLPDWHCASCNFMVYGSKQNCGKCGAENPNWNVTSTSAPAVVSTDNLPTTKDGKTKLPDWYCATCNFMVFGSKPACRCGKQNPNWSSSTSASASAKPDVPQPASASASSTTAAANTTTTTQKSGKGGKLPDWHCADCNFRVFGSKPACGKCGKPNPNWPTNDEEDN